RFILLHANAFPVNRENPGPSVIKTPVKWLKKKDLSLIMFPSGTRHSQKLKGGAILIAKLSGVPIVPAVYQGPLTFKGLLTRKKTTVAFGDPIYLDRISKSNCSFFSVAFGDPIYLDRKMKINDENQKIIIEKMEQQFNSLDKSINPDFKYIDVSKK